MMNLGHFPKINNRILSQNNHKIFNKKVNVAKILQLYYIFDKSIDYVKKQFKMELKEIKKLRRERNAKLPRNIYRGRIN